MDSIKQMVLNRKYQESTKKLTIKRWQEDALAACKLLTDSNKYKGSIFQMFKKHPSEAHTAFLDCQELAKPYSLYFLKIVSKLVNPSDKQ